MKKLSDNPDVKLAIYRALGFYTEDYFNGNIPASYKESEERFNKMGITIVLKNG